MRIAIIGLGHVARFQIAALAGNPDWEIVGAADLRQESASILPPHVPFHSSAPDLLEETDAEACLVATGHTAHYRLGKQVLESGRHLILEKPCCSTLDQFVQLIDLAERRNRLFVVALHAAYALDLRWFLARRDALGLGGLTGFQSQFYDPYIENGQLLEAGRSLGGSWIDSGINALSVLATITPPEHLSVTDAHFARPAVPGCSDTQASVSISGREAGRDYQGCIETHWALGLDSKSTRLFFGNTNSEVLLDHSNECVFIRRQSGEHEAVDLRNGRPRLTNHYTGVFDAAHRMLCSGTTNLALAVTLHKRLHAAFDFRIGNVHAS